MKKFVAACLVAIPLAALAAQPAAAWCKFGFGVNLGLGGRKCAWDGGQPPCETSTTHVAPTCYPAPPAGHRPPAPAEKKAEAVTPIPVQPIDYQTAAESAAQPAGYYLYYSPFANGYYLVPAN